MHNTNVKQEKCVQDLEATNHHEVQLYSNYKLHMSNDLQGYKLNTKRKKIQILQAPYKGVTMSSAHITLETFKEKKEIRSRIV